MKQSFITVVCVGVLVVILNLGLWPFHAPKNEVTWVPDRNGLRFGDYGTVMSSGSFPVSGSPDKEPCSIEIWLQPALPDGGGTILTFYTPRKATRFSLYQSITDLLVQSAGHHPSRGAKFYVSDIFRHAQPLFVTVASGAQGSTVYVNGAPTRTAPQFRLNGSDCAGRLIVGDSVLQQDTWSGDVRGLAIYHSELSASAVLRHYDAWTQNGRPVITPNERNVALYLFDERTGNVVHDCAGSGIDLKIPATYTVLDQLLLEPFWNEFYMRWSYWTNLLKNIVGFIPLGFCFYAYFSLVCRWERSTLITVVAGALVSLTIEIGQAYLPTRQSGTTDLFTNTLGTYLGVLAYQAAGVERWLRTWYSAGSSKPS